jgi:hypothetical protein
VLEVTGSLPGGATSSGICGATVEPVAGRALLRFKTLPRNVRLLWLLAAFLALNVSVRFVA